MVAESGLMVRLSPPGDYPHDPTTHPRGRGEPRQVPEQRSNCRRSRRRCPARGEYCRQGRPPEPHRRACVAQKGTLPHHRGRTTARRGPSPDREGRVRCRLSAGGPRSGQCQGRDRDQPRRELFQPHDEPGRYLPGLPGHHREREEDPRRRRQALRPHRAVRAQSASPCRSRRSDFRSSAQRRDHAECSRCLCQQ